MKALELTIYPKSRGWFGPQYDMPNGWPMLVREGADVLSQRKRLTGAELAAEYWRANAVGWMHEDAGEVTAADRYQAQAATWRRFATLPHYDEEPK